MNNTEEVQKEGNQPAVKMTGVQGCEPQKIGDCLGEMAQKTDTLESNALLNEQENKESGDREDCENNTRPSFSEWETVKSVPPPKPSLRRSVSAADRLSYLPGCTPKDLMEFEKLKKEVEATPLFDPNEVIRLQNMEKRRKISNVSMVNMPTQPPTDRPAAAKMLYLPGCSPQEIQKYHRRTSSPMRWSNQNSVTSSVSGVADNEKEPVSERSSTTPWEDFAYYDGNESKPIVLNFPKPTVVEPEESEKKCRNIYMKRSTEAEELIPPAKPISIREWSMREQSRTWFHRAFSCFFACLKPCFK
ncbi:unnamed protein product [Caenorhabditis brenneri]